jgi:hypothetical protein
MTAGWNFERRRDTCARFLIGVSMLAKAHAERDTSLEAVRNRMRLSPEEALFAARRLNEEEFIVFAVGGAVRSKARGVERAEAVTRAVIAKAQRHDDVLRTLRAGGTELAVVAAVLRAAGAPLACGAPDDDAARSYRLALVGDAVTLERQRDDGAFEAVSLAG